jgi:DNA-directed RNA polymerase specialized sigma24 family protein
MNLTEEQVRTIEDVMYTICEDMKFDIYDGDDMAQEIFLICAELTKKYDESKGAYFPYLLGAARNKVISFVRKHYGNVHSGNYNDRIAIRKTRDISKLEILDDSVGDDYLVERYSDYINANIPAGYREDFLKMREGIKISYPRRSEILEYIKNCMNIVDEASEIDNG